MGAHPPRPSRPAGFLHLAGNARRLQGPEFPSPGNKRGILDVQPIRDVETIMRERRRLCFAWHGFVTRARDCTGYKPVPRASNPSILPRSQYPAEEDELADVVCIVIGDEHRLAEN